MEEYKLNKESIAKLLEEMDTVACGNTEVSVVCLEHKKDNTVDVLINGAVNETEAAKYLGDRLESGLMQELIKEIQSRFEKRLWEGIKELGAEELRHRGMVLGDKANYLGSTLNICLNRNNIVQYLKQDGLDYKEIDSLITRVVEDNIRRVKIIAVVYQVSKDSIASDLGIKLSLFDMYRDTKGDNKSDSREQKLKYHCVDMNSETDGCIEEILMVKREILNSIMQEVAGINGKLTFREYSGFRISID